MKTIKNTLMSVVLLAGLSVAVAAQKDDQKKPPPKNPPPVVTPQPKPPPDSNKGKKPGEAEASVWRRNDEVV